MSIWISWRKKGSEAKTSSFGIPVMGIIFIIGVALAVVIPKIMDWFK